MTAEDIGQSRVVAPTQVWEKLVEEIGLDAAADLLRDKDALEAKLLEIQAREQQN